MDWGGGGGDTLRPSAAIVLLFPLADFRDLTGDTLQSSGVEGASPLSATSEALKPLPGGECESL